MPKDRSIHKVLVIGSGPIVIGQAAEFDYAGAQACRILRQEGIETVLVNSNPATIMTDKKLADAIYLEPLTPETLRRIIAKERPDGLLAGLGGQTGLTLAMQLSRDGTLQKYGVRLLGSDIESIERAEDRERFRESLPSSLFAASVENAHRADDVLLCDKTRDRRNSRLPCAPAERREYPSDTAADLCEYRQFKLVVTEHSEAVCCEAEERREPHYNC